MEEPQLTPSESTAARAADALRELQAHAQSAISTRRERMSQLEADITQRIDSLAETLAAQRVAEAETAANIGETKTEIGQLQAQLDQQDRELRKRADQLADLERQINAREAVVDQRSAEFVQRDEELTQRQQELDLREHSLDRRDEEADGPAADEREAQWQVERAEREREHDVLAQTVAELQLQAKSHEETAAEWKAQRAELEAELSEQRAAVARLQSELEAAKSVDSDEAELETELAASREQLAGVEQAATAARAERDEVQQKFALAHEDVQRFRARIAELEQELARRPAPDQTDTTELVALRAERDALAERLEALENQPAEPANAADAAQQADLQRRFELAVEDVRELKTLNAQLETQLAASRKHSGPATDAGGMDWESQKRRMLASLEGENDDGEPQRQHERTTIAETIQMTDAIVAEKDKEIERLQAQLAGSAGAPPPSEKSQQEAIDELVDADEVIRQYREKIAEQHQEMEEKLRAAELELSVERAKIARERVELDQLKIDLDNARKNLPGGGAVLTQPGPKKRWLSKLGLSGDE